jgi:ketosteroid isomerase-like protein
MVANDGVVFVIGFFEGRARQTDRTWTTAFVHALSMGDGRLVRWRAFFDTAAAVEAHARD